MLEASETRRRFVVEDGKMKCNLAGRTRGKRCGSTLMIDGSITCSADHKFTLDELATAALSGKPNSLIARSILAITNQDYDLVRKLIETVLKEKFSPPFSMPSTNKMDLSQDQIYRWMDQDPWEFTMLLQLADWWHPQYAEALRQVWVARSAHQGETLNKALRKLSEEAGGGDFHSQMLRDHLIDCARRSSFAITVDKKTLQYYTLIEALKVNGDTDLLWLYENSLKELSMIRREPRWHPIIFEYDDRNARRLIFRLYFRRLMAGSDIIDGQLNIRMYDSGYVEFEAQSGMSFSEHPAPSHTAVENAVERELRKLDDHEGKFFRICHGDLRPKDNSSLNQEHWQLKAIKDLRRWLCTLEVEADAE